MFRAFSPSSAVAPLAFDLTGSGSLPLYHRRIVPPGGSGVLRDWSYRLNDAGRNRALGGEELPVVHRAIDDANLVFAAVAAF